MNVHRAEWIGMLTLVCVVLGGLLRLTVQTQQEYHMVFPATMTSTELAQEHFLMETKIQRLQEEVARLRDEPGSSQWNRMMMLAALTPVAGPGVEVTLADNPQMKPDMSIPGLSYPGIIHDADILRVVNELFAAKAEAVAIDKQRVGPGTPVRCIGPLINVNQVACAPPYKIDAIGDPETLQHAFDLPGGVAAELKSVGCVVTVEHRSMMLLPAFDGAVDFKFAHTVRSSGKGDDGL